MKKLSAAQVKAFVERSDPARVINVLPEEHHRAKHIPGSSNVPLNDDTFIRQVEQVVGDKAVEVIVYCADASCNASPKAAEKLEHAGFRSVSDFEGGVDEWEKSGYALEGEAVAS